MKDTKNNDRSRWMVAAGFMASKQQSHRHSSHHILIAHNRPHHNRRQKRQEITSHTVLTAHPSHQEPGDPLQAAHE